MPPSRENQGPNAASAETGTPREKLHAGLTAALRAYLAGATESALEQAYEIGRDALRDGLGLLELSTAHDSVLREELTRVAAGAEAIVQIVERAAVLFRESMAPFEMAQRGYREANDTLKRLNETLEERARELARANAEVRTNLELIASQRDALLRAQQQKEQLTAFVVHDLKSPLTGIVLNATVLSRTPGLSADDKATALTVVNAARSMNRMVMDILDIGRSEDGVLTPRRTQVDIAKLIEHVSAAVKPKADAASQRIETVLDLECATCSADEDLLRRVLENLLDNALRYTPRGEGVFVDVRNSSAGTEIRVRDSGPGIPEADRERVFEKYVQLEATPSATNRTGRGLGLLFCRLAVVAHGGRIWIEGLPMGGAVFALSLPVP